MKDFKKVGRRNGSTSKRVCIRSHSSIVRNFGTKTFDGRFTRVDLRDHKVVAKIPLRNVYIGPSIKGQGLKLVEVVRGNVEDKKPYFA